MGVASPARLTGHDHRQTKKAVTLRLMGQISVLRGKEYKYTFTALKR
jgi:hypothetical protein